MKDWFVNGDCNTKGNVAHLFFCWCFFVWSCTSDFRVCDRKEQADITEGCVQLTHKSLEPLHVCNLQTAEKMKFFAQKYA